MNEVRVTSLLNNTYVVKAHGQRFPNGKWVEADDDTVNALQSLKHVEVEVRSQDNQTGQEPDTQPSGEGATSA